MPSSLFLFFSFILVGCTNFETDRTTNYSKQIYDTRIDAEALGRKERTDAVLWENYYYKRNSEALKKELEPLLVQRKPIVDQLLAKYPECRKQKYCASELTHTSVKRMEDYNRESQKLRRLDFQIVDIENKLADLKEVHGVNIRRLYNRFLVGELSRIREHQPRIKNLYLHSLQMFNSRGAVSRKLLTYADQNIVAAQMGDLDFRMLGKAVDEGAILLTLDVHLNEQLMLPTDPPRYLITLLVNTHQLDELEYDTDFLKEWSKQLAIPGMEQLRKAVYCGLYTIAGSTLASKMQLGKLAYCRWQRAEMQNLHADQFLDRFPPERWLLPISFVQVEPKLK